MLSIMKKSKFMAKPFRSKDSEAWPGLGPAAIGSLFLLSLVLLQGCTALLIGASGAAGAAGAAWVQGDLEATLDAAPQAIEQAAVQAFEQMGIRLISSSSTALDGKIIGRTATDTKIDIRIESEEENRSDISIRVGTFGDQKMSRRLLDQIIKQL
jgi:hypothetical protein